MPIDWRIRRAVFCGLVVLAALLVPVLSGDYTFTPAQAAPASQESLLPYAGLTQLDIQDFPQVRAYFEAYDPSGSFATGLSAGEVKILENEQTLTVSELVELVTGVQLTVAVTFGQSMGIRDGIGFTRYDYFLEQLKTWEWSTDPQNPDDLSVIIDGGPEAVHLDDPGPIMSRLMNFNPETRQAVPSLQTLSRAMEITLDPLDRPGMHRAVLFITPPLEVETVTGLQSLAAQARQGGVRIFIWQIAALDALDTPTVQQMQTMANETGGQFLNFSGVEELPNIETYLEPLRHTYQLTYTSKAASSGTYSVQAVIQKEGLELESQPIIFEINLQQPNPVFMTLPSHIERSAVQKDEVDQPGDENSTETSNTGVVDVKFSTPGPSKTEASEPEPADYVLEPREKELQVLIEFPDGYQRSLVESRLIVDGVVVWHNRSAPFDTFTWNLDPYTEDGQHSVQVVITDVLGLEGASMTLPVEITVVGVPVPLSERFSGRGLWVGGVAVLVVAAVIGLWLVLGGRLQPYSAHRSIFSRPGPSSNIWKKAQAARQHAAGLGKEIPFGLPGWISHSVRHGTHPSLKALAYLVPVIDGETSTRETPIALQDKEIILGRDPRQVTRVLPDLALEDIHSRLSFEDGKYRLFDLGTTAGTWVNLQAVPEAGVLLRHGDLVHIGRTAFRFTARDSKDARKPVIISVEQTFE